jgi:hypothetical protein
MFAAARGASAPVTMKQTRQLASIVRSKSGMIVLVFIVVSFVTIASIFAIIGSI